MLRVEVFRVFENFLKVRANGEGCAPLFRLLLPSLLFSLLLPKSSLPLARALPSPSSTVFFGGSRAQRRKKKRRKKKKKKKKKKKNAFSFPRNRRHPKS